MEDFYFFSTIMGKVEQCPTFCKSCEQPLRSNALQEATGQGLVELQITFPQSWFRDVQCDAATTLSAS